MGVPVAKKQRLQKKEMLWLEEMNASSQKRQVTVFSDRIRSQWP